MSDEDVLLGADEEVSSLDDIEDALPEEEGEGEDSVMDPILGDEDEDEDDEDEEEGEDSGLI